VLPLRFLSLKTDYSRSGNEVMIYPSEKSEVFVMLRHDCYRRMTLHRPVDAFCKNTCELGNKNGSVLDLSAGGTFRWAFSCA
jgi:hypothetical protein